MSNFCAWESSPTAATSDRPAHCRCKRYKELPLFSRYFEVLVLVSNFDNSIRNTHRARETNTSKQNESRRRRWREEDSACTDTLYFQAASTALYGIHMAVRAAGSPNRREDQGETLMELLSLRRLLTYYRALMSS